MIVAIITVSAIAIFFIILISRYIYKKKHNLPTGECACCQHRNVKRLYKRYKKENNN